MSEFVIPKSGLTPAPEVEQPNIFPMEWRVETPKLEEIYMKVVPDLGARSAAFETGQLDFGGVRFRAHVFPF